MPIAVHLRDVDDMYGSLLTEVHHDEIDDLFRVLKRWGVMSVPRDVEVGNNADLGGQFVLNEEGAYFEILIGGDS